MSDTPKYSEVKKEIIHVLKPSEHIFFFLSFKSSEILFFSYLCLSFCNRQPNWWCVGPTSPSWRRAPPFCCRTRSKWAPASTSTSSLSSSTSTRPSSWRSSWPTLPCVSSWTTKASNRTARCPSSRRNRPRRCRRSRGKKRAGYLCSWIINAVEACLWHAVDWTLTCYGL